MVRIEPMRCGLHGDAAITSDNPAVRLIQSRNLELKKLARRRAEGVKNNSCAEWEITGKSSQPMQTHLRDKFNPNPVVKDAQIAQGKNKTKNEKVFTLLYFYMRIKRANCVNITPQYFMRKH